MPRYLNAHLDFISSLILSNTR